jgi:solute carrier family 25 protein 38
MLTFGSRLRVQMTYRIQARLQLNISGYLDKSDLLRSFILLRSRPFYSRQPDLLQLYRYSRMSTVPLPPSGPIRTTKDLKAAHHLSSGGASGLASAITLQPLDLLKTRLQQAYATETKGAKRCVPSCSGSLEGDAGRTGDRELTI